MPSVHVFVSWQDLFKPVKDNTNTPASTGIPKIYTFTVSVMQIMPTVFREYLHSKTYAQKSTADERIARSRLSTCTPESAIFDWTASMLHMR